MANVSLVLCDDPYIRGMNLLHRDMDSATDVLSFEMQDEMDYKASCGLSEDTKHASLQLVAPLKQYRDHYAFSNA